MACRKATYRAMTELSDYMEKQQEEAARQQSSFEEENRKFWTPSSVLESCCLQFLVNGPEMGGRGGIGSSAVCAGIPSGRRGCSGGCLKAHPRITLNFEGGRAVAKFSHQLDPFVEYFREFTEAPEDITNDSASAQPQQQRVYLLTGPLSDHYEKLKSKFASHLISVHPKALAASSRAHERQMEQKEVADTAKRQKVRGNAAHPDMLANVLEICYNHSLHHHLDVADISWMRLASKSMAKIAARMASDRMKQIDLSYSALVSPFVLGEMMNAELMSEEEFSGRVETFGGLLHELLEKHKKMSRVHGTKCIFAPDLPTSFEWDKELPLRYLDINCGKMCYTIKVYIEGKDYTCPEKNDLFSNTHTRLEVARYCIDMKQIRQGEFRSHSLTVSQNQIETDENGSLLYNIVARQEEENELIWYNGSFAIQSIRFDFNDLLGIYVRRKLRSTKQYYQSSQVTQPAMKAYIKALAKAAKEAPGNATLFHGMHGW